MAAVTADGQLFTRVRSRSLNSFDSVTFLRHLRVHLPAGKPLIIWDGSPLHRFKAMRAFQASTFAAENFVFESLPAYAPDLNPLDTGVWHLLKDVALANVCGHDLVELRGKTHRCHRWIAPPTSSYPSRLCWSEAGS